MIMKITKKSIKRTILISIPNHRNQLEHLSERYKKQKHHIIKNLKKKKKKQISIQLVKIKMQRCRSLPS